MGSPTYVAFKDCVSCEGKGFVGGPVHQIQCSDCKDRVFKQATRASTTHDEINHPSHYTAGKIESIEFIEDQGHGRGFCYGNAMKYLTRAPHKGTEVKDLKKAVWYIQRLIQQLEPQE